MLSGRGANVYRGVCSKSCSYLGHKLSAVSFPTQVQHSAVHIVEILLLWSQDRARSRNSNPTYEGRWRETEMFHAVQSNQSSRPSETCLTMDSDGTRFVFGGCEELGDNLIRRCSSINEEEVHVLDPLLSKLGLLVLWFIQSDD